MSPEMEYFILFFLTKLEKFKLSKKKLVRANMQSEFCSNKSSTVHTVLMTVNLLYTVCTLPIAGKTVVVLFVPKRL